jgi:hypothetical protein
VVLSAVVGLVGLELGLFGGEDPALQQAPPDDRLLDADPEPSARAADPEPGTTTTTTETAPIEPAQAETSETDSTSDAGESETSTTGVAQADPDPAPPQPSTSGWCHMHEDSYTLLTRTTKRKASFEHEGSCWVCRTETRTSRTRNFSPRDCAGYSLCGTAAAEECR